jgi:exonuclease VII small subunit
MTEETANFKKHYQRIQQIAEDLRQQTEPDLDLLLVQVDQAMESYHFCKDRIARVRGLLAEKFGEG